MIPKGIKIDKPRRGRRLAIGDIHGCFETFKALIQEEIKLTKDDQLFLLGDYIDKGKRNKEVLDHILQLKQENYAVFPLMGNHEYFVIRDWEYCQLSNNNQQVKDLINSKDLLNELGVVEDKYMAFIYQLPYYYELDDFLLVHAGLDFEIDEPLKDTSSMIYARAYQVDKTKIDGKTLIHGHTPIDFEELKEQIKNHQFSGRINLDNGCVYKNNSKKITKDWGRLCGLNLDSLELFVVENMD